jgi:hypothetical protein
MKNLKVWLLLALVFIAGGVGGVVTTRVVTRRVMARMIQDPALFRLRIERDLDRQLRLNPQQRQQMRDILRSSHERIRDVRQHVQPQIAGIMQDTRKNIADILTPDQQKRFDRLLEENRQFLPFGPR